jgi:RHS repeat-associated protein
MVIEGINAEISICNDGGFEHLYKRSSGGTKSEEHNEFQVMDGRSRIASVRVGSAFGLDASPTVRYTLEDHLGNASFTLDSTGSLTNREEFFPFGETSFGSYSKKRYRFCGKERDEESGLYYYGARYYMPWQCRFVSVDPLAAEYPHYSPFLYAGNKPIVKIDLDGLSESGGGEPKSHTVKKGDNLTKIAKEYGLEGPQVLIDVNGLESTTIHPGQVLTIPNLSENHGAKTKTEDKIKSSSNNPETQKESSVLEPIENKPRTINLFWSSNHSDYGGPEPESVYAALPENQDFIAFKGSARELVKMLKRENYQIGKLVIASHGFLNEAGFFLGDQLIGVSNASTTKSLGRFFTEETFVIIAACHVGNPNNHGTILTQILADNWGVPVLTSQSWTGSIISFDWPLSAPEGQSASARERNKPGKVDYTQARNAEGLFTLAFPSNKEYTLDGNIPLPNSIYTIPTIKINKNFSITITQGPWTIPNSRK